MRYYKERIKWEKTIWYKYAEATLKSLDNDVDRLLSLYGVTENQTLFVVKEEAIRNFILDNFEKGIVALLTKGASLKAKLTIGSAYFIDEITKEIKSVKLSKDVIRKNALMYVAYTEEKRKGLADKIYHGEINSLAPFYSNYSQGKMPTQKELRDYNKIKGTDYEMWQVKKLVEYEKSGNPDYYVKPRREEMLQEMNRLWKSEKINERIR